MLPHVTRLAILLATLSCATTANADTFVFAAAPPASGDPVECPQYFVIAADDRQYDNHDIVVEGCVILIIEGEHTFASLTMQSGFGGGGTVTHAGGGPAGLQLNITGDCTIGTGGALDVSSKGHLAGQGPGAPSGGNNNAGAGHAGNGGNGNGGPSSGITYGSPIQPSDLGSGGMGTPGGGALRLLVGGTLTVDGAIRANGGDMLSSCCNWGGASGGSVWIETATLAGTGSITADGGDVLSVPFGGNTAGGGGGGRVAVYANTADAFIGTIDARGGQGFGPNATVVKNGGAGTVYQSVATRPHPLLKIDNGLTSTSLVKSTPLSGTGLASLNPALDIVAGSVVTATDMTLTTHFAGVRIDDSVMIIPAGPEASGVHLAVSGDCVIGPFGRVDLSALGYATGAGPGAGQTAGCGGSGAGHGGVGGQSAGGALGGGIYGDFTFPTTLGSGGGADCSASGGHGGGALHLAVGGTVVLDGEIRADGGSAGGGGGGAGGSVWIECESLLGRGVISASGGAGGGASGGGGGGRIAVYSCDAQSNGVSTVALGGAAGGGASTPGQPGTVGFFSDRFGDVTGDCAVDGADLGILLNAWGACAGCSADLNSDGAVDGADLGLMLGAWGD